MGGDACRSRARGGGTQHLRHVDGLTENHFIRGASTEGGARGDDVVVANMLNDEADQGGLAHRSGAPDGRRAGPSYVSISTATPT